MINPQRTVLELVERLAKVDSSEQADATIKIINERHQLLFNNTWKDGRRHYGCFLHIDLSADGKIWIQHDGTDLNAAHSDDVQV